ncbi:hypothetical protein FRC05_011644 [Tulasnella sp. 425]|nr:hypothetical protein FRC05_011644 [Tulasnella sp. 425]
MEDPAPPVACKLIPTLPSSHDKYGTPLAMERVGSSDEIPLPSSWVEHLHPEGNVYYQHAKARLVSDTDPRQAGVAVILNNALETIRSRLPRHAETNSPEVYLNIPDPAQRGPFEVVKYYLVDYGSRSIFWVEDLNILTDLANSGSLVEPFESTRHLRSGLTPEFWTHVEYYPCHQSTYDHEAEKELIAILRHGCVDDTIVPSSVFPYSADECMRYLKLLERLHGDDETSESYRRSWIGRLLASICRSRHINRHGLPYPRVDRLQGLDSYLMHYNRSSFAMALGEILCLGMSKRTFAQLTELWNGRVVYQRHWQPFLERQRSEWRWTALWGLYLIMLNVAQRIYGASIFLVVTSTSFACSAVLVSALMLRAHSPERLKTASDINAYIFMAESFHHGLRPLSIAYTISKACLGYGTLISAGNALHHLNSQFQDSPMEALQILASAVSPLLITMDARPLFVEFTDEDSDAPANAQKWTTAGRAKAAAIIQTAAPTAQPGLTNLNVFPLARWFHGFKERSSNLDGDKFPKFLIWSTYAITIHTKNKTDLNSAPKPALAFRISDIREAKARVFTSLQPINTIYGNDDAIVFKLDDSAPSSGDEYVNFINALNVGTKGCLTLMSETQARALEQQADLRAKHYKSLGRPLGTSSQRFSEVH